MTTMTITNQAEQVTAGIDVTREAGVVLIRDGQDSWLCLADRYDEVLEDMREDAPLAGDAAAAEVYGLLCARVVGRGSPVASINGTSRDSKAGTAAELVTRAVRAGLIDAEEAASYAAA